VQRHRQEIALFGPVAQDGVRQMEQLQASIESNLALAKHAETWVWEEVDTEPEPKSF
jgi:hypothetical protein